MLGDLFDPLVNHALEVQFGLLPGGDLGLQELPQCLQLRQHLLVLRDLVQPLLLCVLHYVIFELFVILLKVFQGVGDLTGRPTGDDAGGQRLRPPATHSETGRTPIEKGTHILRLVRLIHGTNRRQGWCFLVHLIYLRFEINV